MSARILAVLGSPLGDFISALPALQALRERHEGAWFEITCPPQYCELIRKFQLADAATVYVRNKPPIPLQENYYRSFDEIYSLVAHTWRAHDPRIHRTTAKAAPAADFYCHSFGFHVPGGAVPNLFMQAKRSHRIAVHAALDRVPSWGLPNWLATVKALSAIRPLLLVGSGLEAKAFSALIQAAGDKSKLAFGLPLVDLVDQLASCAAFLCHDSGIGHLCSALGVRGVTVHCRSDDHLKIWRPPRACAVIRQADPPSKAVSEIRLLLGS